MEVAAQRQLAEAEAALLRLGHQAPVVGVAALPRNVFLARAAALEVVATATNRKP
jgi:hypothetical protein